jgi:hypothetical protein
MCPALVFLGETQTWTPFAFRHFLVDDRLQANIRGHARVLETFADVFVSDFLLSHVCSLINSSPH